MAESSPGKSMRIKNRLTLTEKWSAEKKTSLRLSNYRRRVNRLFHPDSHFFGKILPIQGDQKAKYMALTAFYPKNTAIIPYALFAAFSAVATPRIKDLTHHFNPAIILLCEKISLLIFGRCYAIFRDG